MHLPQVRCYHPAGTEFPHEFFILSKGNNAGQPSFKPWTNSFRVVCTNDHWFDFYFWLVYGLFKAKKFKPRLRGSVIPFINRCDVQDLIKEVAPEIYPHWDKYRQLITVLDKLQQKKASLAEQIAATEKLQEVLLHQIFKNK